MSAFRTPMIWSLHLRQRARGRKVDLEEDRLTIWFSMECVLLDVTPGVCDSLLNIGPSNPRSIREIVSRRLDLALAECDRAPEFVLSNSDSSCSSQFLDAALANTMTAHETVLKEGVDIQQSLGDRLDHLEYFHRV